jgi:hypothetical protein
MRNAAFFALSLLPFLLGCSSSSEGMIASFVDLSSELAQEGSAHVQQNRVISVPGLLPPPAVGFLYRFRGKRGPTSMIGLSPCKDSFYITTTIRSTASQRELQEAQRSFVEMRTKALMAIQAQLDLARLHHKTPMDPGAYAQAEQEAKARVQGFDRAYDNTLKKINSSGILIYRWTSKKTGGGSGRLGAALLGLGKERSRTSSGFAFLAGLRTSTLYVGSDLRGQWSWLDPKKNPRDLRLITHLRQSRDILYMSDSELASALSIRLRASLKDLSTNSAIRALDKIEINAILMKVENVSNAGWIGPVERQMLPAPWNGNVTENLVTVIQDCESWNTFYFVDVQLQALQEQFQ